MLSGNDPIAPSPAFSAFLGQGAVWCPINPRNGRSENQFILDAFDCSALIFHSSYLPPDREDQAEPHEARAGGLPGCNA